MTTIKTFIPFIFGAACLVTAAICLFRIKLSDKKIRVVMSVCIGLAGLVIIVLYSTGFLRWITIDVRTPLEHGIITEEYLLRLKNSDKKEYVYAHIPIQVSHLPDNYYVYIIVSEKGKNLFRVTTAPVSSSFLRGYFIFDRVPFGTSDDGIQDFEVCAIISGDKINRDVLFPFKEIPSFVFASDIKNIHVNKQ